MTTKAAARLYEAQHLSQWGDKRWACYNPLGKPVEELPIIYGFNNGGAAGWYSGCLLAEDGRSFGGHICSSEGYMPHDLGILEGSRPDRHEHFREHYPDGYRMEFIGRDHVMTHAGLNAAYERNQDRARAAQKDGDA